MLIAGPVDSVQFLYSSVPALIPTVFSYLYNGRT